eukprot:12938065-Prorocentrum_lima.AAC.1
MTCSRRRSSRAVGCSCPVPDGSLMREGPPQTVGNDGAGQRATLVHEGPMAGIGTPVQDGCLTRE